MTQAYWAGDSSRRIEKRIVVEGDLVLQTPAHLGNGESDDLVDMPLLVDPGDGVRPLLTGASIAGALRSALRERSCGYGIGEGAAGAAALLFGGIKGDDDGEQSPLIVDDALGATGSYGVELRDGVRIDPQSRTAADSAKFDLQLWQAGTKFPLRFELVLRRGDDHVALQKALATALAGFNDGSITLGARKRRGYGRVKVAQWHVRSFDLAANGSLGLRDWLLEGANQLGDANAPAVAPKDLPAALGATALLPDKRNLFTMDVSLSLAGSLLIRTGGGTDDIGPDTVHLHARQADGTSPPVLSGTSLSGALGARARKIVKTLMVDKKAEPPLIGAMWGATRCASRLEVEEHKLGGTYKDDLVQNRVSIDRFTGGARDGALFNEQPVFGDDASRVKIVLKLRNPQEAEVGLLLQLLKDLWTEDLPLGGESSVGRGRLKGREAQLKWSSGETWSSWKIETDKQVQLTVSGSGQDSEGVVVNKDAATARAELEVFAAALWDQLTTQKGEADAA
jgi:CRISPR/Cas system CSM-associated protein Csm3 (group 7 of RAMP superfamily)